VNRFGTLNSTPSAHTAQIKRIFQFAKYSMLPIPGGAACRTVREGGQTPSPLGACAVVSIQPGFSRHSSMLISHSGQSDDWAIGSSARAGVAKTTSSSTSTPERGIAAGAVQAANWETISFSVPDARQPLCHRRLHRTIA